MAIFLFSVSCNNRGDIGMELLPATDLINVTNVTEKNSIRAYTFSDDSLRTDESSASLLGYFNDPVFGSTGIDLALQFRLRSFPDFGTNPVADSIFLYFYYRTVYGDTSSVQNLRVYELQDAINPAIKYYDAVDLSQYASTFNLADFDFQPRVKLDSVHQDTTYQLVGIKLDNSLAQKLLLADSLDMVSNEAFLQYFRGLFIKSVGAAGTGAIVSLNLLGSSSISPAAVVLYYHNSKDTSNMAYYVSENSARINSFNHDYSQTPFYSTLNKEHTVDTLLYIQSTGGLQSKLYLPFLDSWKDSARISVNKAELIFTVDTLASEHKKYPLPDQLFLTYIDDKGKEYLPRDYSFLPLYYGGYLFADKTYRFNITQHLQSIIDGDTRNNGFYLTPSNKNSEMRRVVLKGSGSAMGIRMVITYSKFNQ